MALIPCQVLRAAILLSYLSVLCHYKAIEMPAHQTYGGSWKFLTFIDLVIQATFFGICVLSDLSCILTKGSDSMEQERQLKKLMSLRDWMLAVLAFPVGVFVVTMFWAIYMYDRELVYPKLLDNFIPPWLTHGMHTTVLPFILIEMRTSHHNYPSRTCGLATVSSFAICYILWVCWVHHVTGIWVYPLLEHISSVSKIFFFFLFTFIINVYYICGEKLNSYIWDSDQWPYNLTRGEVATLSNLRARTDIVIKESNKGGNIVLSREYYCTEALRQLQNPVNYEKLSGNPPTLFKGEYEALRLGLGCQSMDTFSQGGASCYCHLLHAPQNTQEPPMPARKTYLAGIGGLTEKACVLIDRHLQPFVTSLESYVRDSMDILRQLDSIVVPMETPTYYFGC
ncbi:androgen-induced gene 1 protein [Gastrophryne carolinensis]